MKRKNSIGLIALLIVGIIVAIIAIRSITTKTDKQTQQEPAVTVTTKVLHNETLPAVIATYGTTYAPHSVTLKAPSSGTITQIHFIPGQLVEAGQVLFRLRAANVDNQLGALKARMNTSKSLYQRQKKLAQASADSISKYALLKSKLQYQQDAAAYQEAYKLNTILAPVAGHVSDTSLKAGSFVTPNTTLATISNNDNLQIRYQLGAQYAAQLKPGQKVTFQPNNSDKTYVGTVSYISNQLDPNNYNFTIKANLHAAGKLPANRYGLVRQFLSPQVQLALPQDWTQTDAKGYFIFSVDHHKVVKRYFIPDQVTAKGLITVKSGLKPGTIVITSPTQSLNPGQKIKIANTSS